MEALLSLQSYLSWIIPISAAVVLISYYIVHRARFTRAAILQQPSKPSPDYLCDTLLSKAELLLEYAADNGINVAEPTSRAIHNFRLINQTERTASAVDDLFHVAGPIDAAAQRMRSMVQSA
jgi:hypothetical protein